jgi:hypothetical protein
MMTVPVSVAVLFAAGGTLIMISAFMLYAMVGKVNQKLPEEQQIGYVLFHPSKAFRITREYKRLYPQSHLNAVRIVLNMAGGTLIIAGAALLSHVAR